MKVLGNRASVDEAIWTTAQRLREFSYAQLAVEAKSNIDRVTRLVKEWQAAGKAEMIVAPAGRRRMFRVIAGGLPITAAIGSAQGNMWRAMRSCRSFCPTDLAMLASNDMVKVTVEDATAYCQMLNRANYLRVERKAVPPAREAIYRLIRNTGPGAPTLRRIRAVVDPNLNEIVHVAGGMQ